jgi:hypothetical protein
MRAAVPGMALAVLGLFNIAGSVAAGFVVQRYSMRGTLAGSKGPAATTVCGYLTSRSRGLRQSSRA